MKRNNYTDIKTMAELRRVRQELAREVEDKTRELGDDYARAKAFYTPATLLANALRTSAAGINWLPVALRVIRLLKAKIRAES